MSPSSILNAIEYLEFLREEYEGIEVPFYMFREWISVEERFFFDCEGEDLAGCLEEKIGFEGFSHFRVFLIVEGEGGYAVKDISYPNVGNSSFTIWAPRFERNLKPAALMSLNASGVELVKELGYSYR
jgi:hypothetical protein